MFIWSLDAKINGETKEVWIDPSTGKVINVFVESTKTEEGEGKH